MINNKFFGDVTELIVKNDSPPEKFPLKFEELLYDEINL